MLSFSSSGGPSNRSVGSMWSAYRRILLSLIFLISIMSQKSDGEEEKYWCIADVQIPDEVVQRALDWACANGGDCSEIQQPNQPCFFPNTIKDHASYAFNSYYQSHKHARAPTCYFNAAALITSRDPSHGACKFEFLP